MGSREKISTILEVSCPADVNISKKINEKLNNYAPLVRNMQIIYSHYKFYCCSHYYWSPWLCSKMSCEISVPTWFWQFGNKQTYRKTAKYFSM